MPARDPSMTSGTPPNGPGFKRRARAVFNGGGAIATAACQAGHAVLAASGQWLTNEKALLDRAGVRGVDEILAGLTPDAGRLTQAVDRAEALLQAAGLPGGSTLAISPVAGGGPEGSGCLARAR
jgi:hypothetical protein